MKSHYIILLVCILFGLQSPIAAQSSNWVYSPYAQYLTNDTTIPPPVGEPAGTWGDIGHATSINDYLRSKGAKIPIYLLYLPTIDYYVTYDEKTR